MKNGLNSRYSKQPLLRGKTVCVTGAGGFIASHLLERLASEGAKVRGMLHYNSRNDWGRAERLPESVRSKIRFHMGDILDPNQLRDAFEGCDYVIHLAALISIPYSYEAPEMYVAVNVHGTQNVLEVSRKLGVKRIVHTSTSEVYGTARYVPIDEAHPLQAQSPYAASKIAADKLAESYFRSFDVPVVTVRPFNTYGPRQSSRAVIPSIISQALSTGVVKIGATWPYRDMNYVEDTVDGFIRAVTTPNIEGETFNLSTGKDLTIGQLAKKIIGLMPSKIKLESDPQRIRPENSEVLRLQGDNAKARKKLKWKPAYTLDEGLENTIGWIRANLAYFKPEVYNK